MRPENQTAYELIAAACSKYASRPIATIDGETWTYEKSWRRGGRLANALREYGVEKGDRVAYVMANRLDILTVTIACIRGGYIIVPISNMLATKDIEYILDDSGAKVVIVGPQFTEMIGDVRSSLQDLQLVIQTESESPSKFTPMEKTLEDQKSVANARIEFDDPLRLSYTGGTTGKPKGALQTHGALGLCMVALCLEMEIRPKEEMLFMTHLSHGAGYHQLGGLVRGAHATVTRSFNPEKFLRLIDDQPISWVFLVPTMIYRILDSDRIAETDFSGLDTVLYGAAPISQDRLGEAIDVFGDVFLQVYGSTETSALITSLPKKDHTNQSEVIESVGQPAIMTDIRIGPIGEGQVTTQTQGETGEILVKSPFVFDRYHGNPEETDETIIDGWVRTGDIGRFDEEGYLYLLDRRNDVIISGGMNVYTNQVEDVLDMHPDVNQSAVIGIPHDDWGESVHAVIVPQSDDLTTDEIERFAASNLAGYKSPKSVEFTDELPTTPYGKIDKNQLREPLWEGEERRIH